MQLRTQCPPCIFTCSTNQTELVCSRLIRYPFPSLESKPLLACRGLIHSWLCQHGRSYKLQHDSMQPCHTAAVHSWTHKTPLSVWVPSLQQNIPQTTRLQPGAGLVPYACSKLLIKHNPVVRLSVARSTIPMVVVLFSRQVAADNSSEVSNLYQRGSQVCGHCGQTFHQ